MRKTKAADPELKYKGNAFLRLLGYLRPYKKEAAACLLLALALTGLELYEPMIIGDAIDQYITGNYAVGEMARERFAGVLNAGVLYIGVLLLLFVFERGLYRLMERTGQNIICTMREELFAHVESLTMRYFDTTPVGKPVTRITNDTEAINELYSNILVKLFRNVVKILGLMGVMLAINRRMALYSFVFVPVTFVLTLVFRKLARRAYQVTKTRVTDLNTFLSEHISGMKLIRSFHREDAKRDQFGEKNNSLYRAGLREIMINACFRPGIYFVSVLALALLLYSGSGEVIAGAVSVGTLYVFITYIKSLYNPIEELAEQFSTLQSAIASAEKIFTLRDTEPLLTDPGQPVTLPEVRGRIEFDHVWFAYQDEDWVLKDVTFTIEPGQKVAFVGATGAGKSSILNLIGRYYDIQRGSIRLDGVDIRQLSREQIRAAIGQVQQDVFIFTGDIASNIRLMNEEISDDAIRRAAHLVNADRFIDRLPNKYSEPVSERGSTFSAGQRQLLSFARTLATDPSILILDEATANIDTETEQWIQEAIAHMMEGRTTIMVAHRLSTIRQADCIMVMHKGRLRESGTHQQLLAQNGIYRKLYELQLA